jgi:hypothetical protein
MKSARPWLLRNSPGWLAAIALALSLAGCDLLGLGPDPRIAQKEADAKAIGGACRHGLRSIEDCYTLNKGVSKSAIYAGWLEMDAYMRDNKIEGLKAQIPMAPPPASAPAPAAAAEEEIVPEPKAKSKAKATH